MDEALEALLTSSSKDLERSESDRKRLSNLPTLDERVDLFLKAILGAEREPTAKEREVARCRLLDSMAADIAEEIASKTAAKNTPAKSPPSLGTERKDVNIAASAKVVELKRTAKISRLVLPSLRRSMQFDLAAADKTTAAGRAERAGNVERIMDVGGVPCRISPAGAGIFIDGAFPEKCHSLVIGSRKYPLSATEIPSRRVCRDLGFGDLLVMLAQAERTGTEPRFE
ncbi:MAG: hypothetical protein WCA78_13950 [Rhizomicrobium sp.]